MLKKRLYDGPLQFTALLLSGVNIAFAFAPTKTTRMFAQFQHLPLQPPFQSLSTILSSPSAPSTRLYFFDKIFEQEGPLGKGITVGKVQVSLQSADRSRSSIFGLLEQKAQSVGNSNAELARLANDVCLSLLRKSDEWVGACSACAWFSEKDASKAESKFNDWSNREATKFEKEYIPASNSEQKGGDMTFVVVSLVLELQGDTTNFDGAGYSLSGTRDVLSSIASDVMVDRGACLNAVEVFWTPSERNEVLTREDVILDFPEIIDV